MAATFDRNVELVIRRGPLEGLGGFSPVLSYREVAVVLAGFRVPMPDISQQELVDIIDNRRLPLFAHSGDLNRRALDLVLRQLGVPNDDGAWHRFPTYRTLARAAQREPGALVFGLRGLASAQYGLRPLHIAGCDPAVDRERYPLGYEVHLYRRLDEPRRPEIDAYVQRICQRIAHDQATVFRVRERRAVA